jgi:hypothetical protein
VTGKDRNIILACHAKKAGAAIAKVDNGKMHSTN